MNIKKQAKFGAHLGGSGVLGFLTGEALARGAITGICLGPCAGLMAVGIGVGAGIGCIAKKLFFD